MVKEKKASPQNLFGRSSLFIVLFLFTLLLSVYLGYLSLFYAVFSLGSLSTDTISLFAKFQSFTLFAALLGIWILTLRLTWLNGKRLWGQWQRQAAIAEENERVQRLVENDSDEMALDDEELAKRQHQRNF